MRPATGCDELAGKIEGINNRSFYGLEQVSHGFLWHLTSVSLWRMDRKDVLSTQSMSRSLIQAMI